MKHAFTVDLEDWYHGIPISAERKAAAERRLHIGTDLLLELLPSEAGSDLLLKRQPAGTRVLHTAQEWPPAGSNQP